MAIVKMQKVSLIGFEKEKDKTLDLLMNSGLLQISEIEGIGNSEEFDYVDRYEFKESQDRIEELLDDIEKARKALSFYDERSKNVFESKVHVPEEKVDQCINKQSKIFNNIVNINELVEKRSDLINEVNKIDNNIEYLLPWEMFELDLSIEKTGQTTILKGVIPNTHDIVEVKKTISEKCPESYFESVYTDNVQHYIAIIVHNSRLEEMNEIIRSYGFSSTAFKNFKGTGKEIISKLRKRKKELRNDEKTIKQSIKQHAYQIEEIEILYDYLLKEKDKISQMSKFAKTNVSFLIEGWMPKREVEGLKEKIEKEQLDLYYEFRDPKEDEEYPVLLDNPSFIKPFELITELFSLPNNKEFDVNPFMAPFYFVFFGLMLSDAGYGLVISLLTGIILIKFDIKGTMKKIISMLFFGGISTFIWGALFGGWFGDIVTQVSQGSIDIKPIWFNPLDDPMRLLIWSCVFGVIQLYTGMALQGYKLWQLGKKIDAIIDVGFRYLYYTGIILLLVGISVAPYVAGVGALGLILTQGRDKDGIIAKIGSGVLSLYDFVGFMSDVLSYSRLLALGLATGVVATVINTMGTLIGFNVFGIIVLILVFIVGHSFNILINALGAYVHASRLQYVEFFSLFYEGGGKPYTPFKINTKYTSINE